MKPFAALMFPLMFSITPRWGSSPTRADAAARSDAGSAEPSDGEWAPGESHSLGRGGAAPSERGVQPYADELTCRAETCSGHGRCFSERNRPYCVCDEGYAAHGMTCTAHAPQPAQFDRSRIVAIAEAEDGHGPFTIGGRVTSYPYHLSRYLTPNDLWCSDFVSWVYRAAGAPLDGGENGGWLIEGNYGMRYWFRSRGRWVARGTREFDRYTPQPGDYVRIHTNRYGHSAIVRYVEGDTLYTVEGNVGNRVRFRRHEHFRRNDRIDGFGRVGPFSSN